MQHLTKETVLNNSRVCYLTTGVIVLSMVLCFSASCNRVAADKEVGMLPADSRLPNVILILVDALRADRLGTYGHPGQLTPAMDELAEEGVTFTRCISQAPWTQPSVASLFSSLYPGVHKVINYKSAISSSFLGQKKIPVFSGSFTTLSEALQLGGYDTAAFVANVFITKEYGFAQGFDHFDASFANNTLPGSVVNAAAIKWLGQRNSSKPFFVYLHYMDVHGPYNADPRFLDPLINAMAKKSNLHPLTAKEMKKLNYLLQPPKQQTNLQQYDKLKNYREYWIARYEAGVRQIDYYLSQLRTELMRLNMWNDTYVIITADHGEALCEHGLWEHGFSTYNTDLHVPLILRWPGVLPAGKRITDVVRLIDVMPTLLAQLRLNPVAGLQGASMLTLISGKGDAAPRLALAEAVKLGPEQKALYRGNWKLHVFTNPAMRKLYDMAHDSAETTNLFQQRPIQAKILLDAMRTQLTINKRLAAQVKIEKVPLTAERRNQLEKLGYIEKDEDDSNGEKSEQGG